MYKFLAFINKKYFIFHSLIIKYILILKGIKVGKNFYCEGIPYLKIRGKTCNLIIEDNVSFLGNVDLRNRENGKIIIKNRVVIEDGVRLVSAREGSIIIGENSVIGAYTIMNGGGSIIIKDNCLISTKVSINANEHIFKRDTLIKNQGYIHKDVVIESDCLIGTNVSINKDVIIAKGSIIGANSVVTKSTQEYKIYGGIPAKEIGVRK